MIPVFVLSLPDCYERRSRISKSLYRLGLSFEFVDAIDGRNGLPKEYENQIDRLKTIKAGRIMCDAEFACSLSHISIYRRIVEEKIEYALILEDDVKPLPSLIKYLSGRYFEDAELTQLYYDKAYVRRKGAKSLFDNYTSHLCSPKMNIYRTCSYVISRRAAEHFIKNDLPVTQVADWPDSIETLVAQQKRRVVSPSLFVHPKGKKESLIQNVGRINNLKSSRVFGIHVPKFKKMAYIFNRAWRKPLCKRLPM